MKTIFLLLTLVGLSASIFGQANDTLKNKAGIYKTSNDFLSGLITYQTNCAIDKFKPKTSEFFYPKKIKVRYQGNKVILKKSSVWGFRLCNAKEYRIYNNKEYEIVDKSGILVYKILETTTTGPKHYITKTKYLFSEDSGSPLKDFTLKNIETSFINNKKFHDAIDLYFKSDADLLIYDDYYKMLRLNHIYLESLK
jgi:hypothetical protein